MKVTQTNSRVNQLSKPYKGKVITISLLRKQNIQQSSKWRQNTLCSQRPLQICQSTHAFEQRKIDADARCAHYRFSKGTTNRMLSLPSIGIG